MSPFFLLSGPVPQSGILPSVSVAIQVCPSHDTGGGPGLGPAFDWRALQIKMASRME